MGERWGACDKWWGIESSGVAKAGEIRKGKCEPTTYSSELYESPLSIMW